MKINFEPRRNLPLHVDQPSRLRRALLMGCAYLPATSLLAVLSGCNEDNGLASDSETITASPSTFDLPSEAVVEAEVPPSTPSLSIPLPPYATTDVQPSLPAPSTEPPPTTVPVTHIPERPELIAPPAESAPDKGVSPEAGKSQSAAPEPVKPLVVQSAPPTAAMAVASTGAVSPTTQAVVGNTVLTKAPAPSPSLSEPVKPPAPPAVKRTRMNVGIYNLEYNSFKQISTRSKAILTTKGTTTTVTINDPKDPQKTITFESADKYLKYASDNKIPSALTPDSVRTPDPKDTTKTLVYEGIETYLKRALDNRFALFYRAMVTAFKKHRPTEFDVSFFTAPEFFWNVPWGDFLNEAELVVSGNLYLDAVTQNARILISKFPEDKYGRIVLLPGTVATLAPEPNAFLASNGAYAGGVGIIYGARNHLVCTHNLPLDDPRYPRPAYMIWPKRLVSAIDYKDVTAPNCNSVMKDDKSVYVNGDDLKANPSNPKAYNYIEKCTLSKDGGVNISIASVSSSLAQSFDAQGKVISNKFQNNIIEELPFGIDICLDYMSANVQSDKYRMAQLDQRYFKLDFVISAGTSLSTANYADTPYIQYAIHNEGILPSSESYHYWDYTTGNAVKRDLYSSIWGIEYDKRNNTVSGELLTPLDARSTYDDIRGVITVDKSVSFIAPADADSQGIPNIRDAMNPAKVRIWSLDVDVSDTVKNADAVAAANTKSVVQFIK